MRIVRIAYVVRVVLWVSTRVHECMSARGLRMRGLTQHWRVLKVLHQLPNTIPTATHTTRVLPCLAANV